jgi:hypothetical protein
MKVFAPKTVNQIYSSKISDVLFGITFSSISILCTTQSSLAYDELDTSLQ